jgi:hypothetical protein
MKIMHFAAALLLGASLTANATPVTYNFSATWSFEYESGVGTAVTNPMFSASDTFSGSFVYENETPLGSTSSLGGAYPNAITSLTGNLGGYSYSLASALGGVNATDDRITFAGYSYMRIGDWQSDLFSLIWYDNTFLGGDIDVANYDLPLTLPPAGFVAGESQVSVNFVNTQTAVRRQVSFSSLAVTPVVTASVPEPATFGLFGLGLMSIFFARRRSLALRSRRMNGDMGL